MIRKLVWASVKQRPARSLLLLVGYGLGVGVTIALLSIGGALVEQSRDQDLIGGGDLAVLPAGVDIETLKTGGVSSMFFTVAPAPFLYREVLASPRFDDQIEAAAPWIDDELVYLELGDELVAASAGGSVPSLAAALGVAPTLVSGTWEDSDGDVMWATPSDASLYASLDQLHLPRGEAAGDSTWAEWHYFNVLLPESSGWLYLTYMIGGAVPNGRWGGQLLATVVEPGHPDRAFSLEVDPRDVVFDEGRANLEIAGSGVNIEPDGTYRLTARIPSESGRESLTLDLRVKAASRRYLPPLDIGGGALTSGYTVPLLDARATGQFCAGSRCRELTDAVTYHDHNWGVWKDVTWDWGQAKVGDYSVLYGGISQAGQGEGSHFVYLADAEGFAGVYPIRSLRTDWPSEGPGGPRSIELLARQGRDSVRLEIDIVHQRVTELAAGAASRPASFYQMRGKARLSGRLRGAQIIGEGEGFFETWGIRRVADSTTVR